jgi:hypothetical protein
MLDTYEKIYIMYQVLRSEYTENNWFSNWDPEKLIIRETPEEVTSNISVIAGGDIQRRYIREWFNKNQPAIYIARGYVGNHLYKTRQLWRYSVNGWANTKLLPIPYSRWNTMKLERYPWKVKKIKNVLIAPSKMTSPLWDPNLGFEWANFMSTQFPGAEVKIRYKPRKSGLRWETLFQDLDWADLVVAQSSAITAEAFWYGKKVISTHPCITWAAQKNTLEDWQNPKEPELRDAWHEHLAWSQFRNEEWKSGEAINLIEKYVGSVVKYDPEYSYNFL